MIGIKHGTGRAAGHDGPGPGWDAGPQKSTSVKMSCCLRQLPAQLITVIGITAPGLQQA